MIWSIKMFSQIIKMLQTCETDHGVLPPTEVYNEGWMLRLILDWFSRQPSSDHEFSFEKGARYPPSFCQDIKGTHVLKLIRMQMVSSVIFRLAASVKAILI